MLTFEATPFDERAAPDWTSLAASRQVALDPALRPAFVGAGAGRENLERLLAGALCVTTGQQPGLLTGPLFTLYKALSAIALARAAEARLSRPVVPVFWVAGDDHDFSEANHCFLLSAQGDVERLELRQRDPAGPLTPLYREPVGAEIGAVLDRFRVVTPETEFRPGVLEWLSRHYRADADLASAFGGALAELLGSAGLVVFQASHAAAKRVMAPWLLRVLKGAADLDRALASRATSLAAAGREVPVTVGDGATPVMVEGRLGRDRLVAQDGRFESRRAGERWTAAELAKLVEREPERFSANVLLRPVIEATILPTLAYAAGPGELAYLPQCDPIYQALGIVPQGRIPRWSGRVLEARVLKTLAKHSLTPDALGREGPKLERELLREEIPAEAKEALAALRDVLEREYQKLARSAAGLDPTLQKTAESARNAALGGVADLEKRLIAHLRKQNDVATAQIARARANLFPLGHPQERVISAVSFLLRYGSAFIEESLAAIGAWAERLEPAHRRS